MNSGFTFIPKDSEPFDATLVVFSSYTINLYPLTSYVLACISLVDLEDLKAGKPWYEVRKYCIDLNSFIALTHKTTMENGVISGTWQYKQVNSLWQITLLEEKKL